MRKNISKLVAMLLSAVMLISEAPVFPVMAAETSEEEVVVARYDMSHTDTQLTDVSGNGNHATLVGFENSDFTTSDGDTILNFSGNAGKYVELPGGIIESEKFTITAEFTASNTGNSGENSWLFCLGSEVAEWPNVKNYLFFCPAQGNNGTTVGNMRAGIKDATNELLMGQGNAITSGTNTVQMAFDNGKLTLSLNGTVIETLDSGYSIQDILENGASDTVMGYIGKSLYKPDPPFKGTLTSFTIEAVDLEDLDVAVDSLELPYNTTDKQVYGNITLPDKTKNGATVTWATTHPAIVDVASHANSGYDTTPAGTVTRPATDTDVTMTATITSGNQTATKEFTFTVKAAPKKLTEEDFTDYFFAYFAGEKYTDGEQIYFAASRDGLNWTDLNENQPILTSSLGEKGVRDPYIIRSAEGDKFYMIATDLNINANGDWGRAQNAGSQAIMVWESTDLVNWSDQRMVTVSASIDAGCTWAPECYYDNITGEYVVYWASKVASDNYEKQRLYYAKTRDFYSFTEPKVYIDYNESSIDTTIIYDEATKMYYRYTKNEGGNTNALNAKTKTVFAEKSSTLLGSWTHIASDSLNNNQWVEGPAIFKFNEEDDFVGEYCLLVDNYGGGGYYPLVATNLSTGEFTTPPVNYKMPSRARHGTPIPVTAEEYAAVMKKWGNYVEENTESTQNDPKLTYTFEQTKSWDTSAIVDDTGSGNDGKLYGNAKIVYDEGKQSNVLYLDGTTNTYAALPKGFFDGRNTITVSMDVKAENLGGNFFTFAIGRNDTYYYFLKTNDESVKSVITTESWGKESGFTQSESKMVLNNWINLTVTIDGNIMKLYVDGVKVAEKNDVTKTISDLGAELRSYLGKSFYSGDGYFKGCFDNVMVYNRALSDDEVAGIQPPTDIVPPTVITEDTNEPLAEYLFNDQDLSNTGTSDNQAYAVVTGLGSYTDNLAYAEGRAGRGYAIDLGSYGLKLNELEIGDEYTVSLWVKPDGTIAGNTPVVAMGYHSPENWMAVSGDSGNTCKFWGNGGCFTTWTTVAKPTIPTEWTHLAFVGTKDQVMLYKNGVLMESYKSNNPLDVEDGDVLVGANYWDDEFNGLADDIKVYNRPLSENEIYLLYNDDITTGLNASYPFDDQTLDNASSDDADDKATAIITGLNNYTGNVVYETGMAYKGYAARIGDYGLRLNQKNLGTDFTVSMWVKLDSACVENQVILFMGYHSPENWMAVSGDTKDAPYKFWGKGGIFNTWKTSAAPDIKAGTWQNLVFTGTSGKITAYLNGVNLGTFDSNDPLSGENADIYVGVNNWDAEAVGLVDNINIYSTALEQKLVEYQYNQAVLEMAAAELDLLMKDVSDLKEDITLPTSIDDVTVSWESSDTAVITNTGAVTRPEDGKADGTATLTATLTINGVSVTKEFPVTVLAKDTASDMADAAKAIVLPEVITEDIKLPTSGKYGTKITWSSSDESVLANNGTIVKKPGVEEGNAAVVMTATFELDGKTFTKEYEVEVMEEFYGYILSYITGTNDRTGSLHLAHSTDGKNFTALNSNSGILFAHIDTNDGTRNLSTGVRFTSPHLFRKADGTFGFTATQSDRLTSVYMYDSQDLISYTGERLLETGSSVGNPQKPEVEFDTLIGAYRLNWTVGGKEYSSVTNDLKTLETAVVYDYVADTSAAGLGTVPSGATVGNVIGVTKAEYDKIVKKLGRVSNTGVEEFEDIRVQMGESVELPETITAYYSDDSTTAMNVTWDTTGLDFSVPGTYTVNGTIDQEIYANPLIEQRADPHIEYDEEEDCYYFTASYPAYNDADHGYDRIALRKADTIAGLAKATEITIWQAPSSGVMAKHVWAPEIHKIEGKWFVFFAAGESSNIWAIRPYVLVCQNNNDPYNAASWKQANGSAEVHAATSKDTAYFKNMSLDMTYFEHNGKHYVIWADIIGQSALYMQEINPSAPWAGTSDKVILLTTPEFGWERDSERVNEGPSVIKNNGKIYVAFSGSGTGPEYCIGLLYADEDADLMDVNSWTKVGYPVLTSSDVPGEYGPGHNSFTVDDNGNAMFVYHARSEECYNNQCQWANSDPLYDPCRHARVKRVHWAADGTPILNMNYEEELNPAYKNVSITVIVEGTDKSALQAEIDLSDALIETDYTSESWSAYVAELAEAKAVFDDINVSQTEVDNACAELETARMALVTVTNTETLAELVADVYVLVGKTDSEELNSQMWTALISELKVADEVLATTEPKQSDVDKAYENLISMKKTVWPAKYTVTVVDGGTLESGVNAASFYAMEMATVIADAKNSDGETFAYWLDLKTGEVISYANKYTFYVLSDVDLKAVYTAEEISVEDSISMSCDAVYDEELQRVVITVRRILPAECTVVEHGILVTKSDAVGNNEEAFTLADTQNVKSVSQTGGEINGLATVKVNVASGVTCYARGYVKYTYTTTDLNGLEAVNEGIFYGEIGSVTAP